MTPLKAMRFSLAFVWLATALVGVLERHGQAAQLLASGGIHDDAVAQSLILSGAFVDAALGLFMLLRPARAVFLAALAVMLSMTVIATVVDSALWLAPLGPLTKNFPIAVALYILARASK